MSSGEPNKTAGQFHSIKGSAVEAVGDATGATSWQQSGREEHEAGENEYDAACAKGYIEGTLDRVEGKKNSIIGAIKGDETQRTQGNAQKDKGLAQQVTNKRT